MPARREDGGSRGAKLIRRPRALRRALWRTLPIGAALLLSLGAQLSCAPEEGTPLGGEEVRGLVSGRAIEGSWGTKSLSFFFEPEGRVVGRLQNSSDTGRWWIRNDLYCHRWETFFAGQERCYRWYRTSEGYALRVTGGFSGRDILGELSDARPHGL